MKTFRVMALMAAPALVLVLAGCAGAESMPGMDHGGRMTSSVSPSDGVGGEFTTADSMFLTMMIPHHQQAVEMSDMILVKTGVDQRVVDLAQQIKDAQGPEIEKMQSWLDAWGMPSSGGMDHGDGMMSGDDMAALEAADGADAARLFLEQMVMHHEGAIKMAQSELASGINPDAGALAQAIVAAQTTEIATMQDLLAQI